MPIRPKDRELVAGLAMTYTAALVLKYGRDGVALEEGTLVAQKLLEVIDRRVSSKS